MNLSEIKLVALDVDGTLTNGTMIYGPSGVSQSFNSKDGAGIIELSAKGILVAFVSFRDFACTRRRAADLGVELLCLGSKNKAESISKLAEYLDIPLSSVLFMGDDGKDIPAMEIVGVSACPRDAVAKVRDLCAIVADSNGGDGAVREVVEMVLEANSID